MVLLQWEIMVKYPDQTQIKSQIEVVMTTKLAALTPQSHPYRRTFGVNNAIC